MCTKVHEHYVARSLGHAPEIGLYQMKVHSDQCASNASRVIVLGGMKVGQPLNRVEFDEDSTSISLDVRRHPHHARDRVDRDLSQLRISELDRHAHRVYCAPRPQGDAESRYWQRLPL